MKKQFNKEKYEAPIISCCLVDLEGVLCNSPVDPGYGGNEDMEEGDDL